MYYRLYNIKYNFERIKLEFQGVISNYGGAECNCQIANL